MASDDEHNLSVVHEGTSHRLLGLLSVSRDGAHQGSVARTFLNEWHGRREPGDEGPRHFAAPLGLVLGVSASLSGLIGGIMVEMLCGLLLGALTVAVLDPLAVAGTLRLGAQAAVMGLLTLSAISLRVLFFLLARWRVARPLRATRRHRQRSLDEVIQVLARLAPLDNPHVRLTLTDRSSRRWHLSARLDGQDEAVEVAVHDHSPDVRRVEIRSPGVQRPVLREWRRQGRVWVDEQGGETRDLASTMGDLVGAQLHLTRIRRVASALRLVRAAPRTLDIPEEAFEVDLSASGGVVPLQRPALWRRLWSVQGGALAFWTPVAGTLCLTLLLTLGFLIVAPEKLSDPSAEIFDVLALYLPMWATLGVIHAALTRRSAPVRLFPRRVRRTRSSVRFAFDGRWLRMAQRAVDLDQSFELAWLKLPEIDDAVGLEVRQGAQVIRVRLPVAPGSELQALPTLDFDAPTLSPELGARLVALLARRAELHGRPSRWTLTQEATSTRPQEAAVAAHVASSLRR